MTDRSDEVMHVELYPQFLEFRSTNATDEALDRLALHLSQSNDATPSAARNSPVLGIGKGPKTLYTDIEHPKVFICGHNSRDVRCGVLGPILQEEFRRHCRSEVTDISVDLCSHVGGHAFAGNVIIYMPRNQKWRATGPNTRMRERASDSLAGKGIWYGRVEPRHCEAIVKETIVGGRIIDDLLRGMHPGRQDSLEGSSQKQPT